MLSHGQEIVLRTHLTRYPKDKSFYEICDLVRKEDLKVRLFYFLRDWEVEKLIIHMKYISQEIDAAITETTDQAYLKFHHPLKNIIEVKHHDR
jgi:hypothetical protein